MSDAGTTGRVAVVTGVGAGSLGEAVAAELRHHGLRVLTSTPTCATTRDTHPLDLTSRDSVTAFADWVRGSADRLDVLVNNAGVHLDLRSAWHEPHLVDGWEVHWRLNYLGTAQLTRSLVPTLLDTARQHGEARVVEVVSALHARGRNEGLDGRLTPYDSWAAYGTSKLALVHEAAEIERRYGDQGLHAYAVHPGAMPADERDERDDGDDGDDGDDSDRDRGSEADSGQVARVARVARVLGRDVGHELGRGLGRGLERLVPAVTHPAGDREQGDGPRTVVWCALSDEPRPGGYHRDGAVAQPSQDAQDGEAGRILWEATTRWVERG